MATTADIKNGLIIEHKNDLYRIVEFWADAALQLSEGDLKLMQRLANAQTRLRAKSAA